jgi:hypothetical protein
LRSINVLDNNTWDLARGRAVQKESLEFERHDRAVSAEKPVASISASVAL